MKPFDLVEPRSLAEAIGCLDRDDPAVRPIAGGTALMLMMKAGLFRPLRLVSLRAIEERFRRIAAEPDGGLRIGAMATLGVGRALAGGGAPGAGDRAHAATLANVRVRNVATIGGHLAHADPHLDLPPVLIALGARLVIAGPAGERAIPIEALFTGYLETVLRHDEMIAELIVPPQAGRRAAYLKCTARSADDWPSLGIAVSLSVEGGIVRDCRIVIGAATETPTRLAAAEAVLRGAAIDDAILRRAGEAAAAEAAIVSDQHGSAAYKKQLLRVGLGRAARSALAAAPEAPR